MLPIQQSHPLATPRSESLSPDTSEVARLEYSRMSTDEIFQLINQRQQYLPSGHLVLKTKALPVRHSANIVKLHSGSGRANEVKAIHTQRYGRIEHGVSQKPFFRRLAHSFVQKIRRKTSTQSRISQTLSFASADFPMSLGLKANDVFCVGISEAASISDHRHLGTSQLTSCDAFVVVANGIRTMAHMGGGDFSLTLDDISPVDSLDPSQESLTGASVMKLALDDALARAEPGKRPRLILSFGHYNGAWFSLHSIIDRMQTHLPEFAQYLSQIDICTLYSTRILVVDEDGNFAGDEYSARICEE
jgi:hypothetical protein